MVYVTGDTHRDFSRYLAFSKRYGWSQDDVMVILGDAGLNYFGGKQDFLLKKEVNSYPITTFCIHGNHEMRPYEIRSYRQKQFCGGTVWSSAALTASTNTYALPEAGTGLKANSQTRT